MLLKNITYLSYISLKINISQFPTMSIPVKVDLTDREDRTDREREKSDHAEPNITFGFLAFRIQFADAAAASCADEAWPRLPISGHGTNRTFSSAPPRTHRRVFPSSRDPPSKNRSLVPQNLTEEESIDGGPELHCCYRGLLCFQSRSARPLLFLPTRRRRASKIERSVDVRRRVRPQAASRGRPRHGLRAVFVVVLVSVAADAPRTSPRCRTVL